MNWKKTGSSSKASALHELILSWKTFVCSIFTKSCIVWSLIVFGIILIFANYYFYLHSLYVVDETYEVLGPNESGLDDQITIRVLAPAKIEELEKFVLHFSICPIVYEIQVLWHSSHDSTPLETFPYTTAHSKVSYQYFRSCDTVFADYFDGESIKTKAVMFFDSDVTVSCNDLSFTYSVWRSSQSAAVGYFPRMIRKVSKSSTPLNVEFLSTYNVYLNNQYHLLLSAAIMLDRDDVKVRDSTIISSSHSLSESSEVKSILRDHPQCYEVLLSLWINSRRKQIFPIWAETEDLQIMKSTELLSFPRSDPKCCENISRRGQSSSPHSVPLLTTPRKKLSEREHSQCVNLFLRELAIDHLPVSTMKSTKARSHWVW